jgi:hypothetical protein
LSYNFIYIAILNCIEKKIYYLINANFSNIMFPDWIDEELHGSEFTIKATVLGDSHDLIHPFISGHERIGKPHPDIRNRNSIPRYASCNAEVTEAKKYIKQQQQYLVRRAIDDYSFWLLHKYINHFNDYAMI